MRLFSICLLEVLFTQSTGLFDGVIEKVNEFFSKKPISKVSCRPNSIVLTTGDCVVEIPMPYQYADAGGKICEADQKNKLGQINACIDPKHGSDKRNATKNLSYEGSGKNDCKGKIDPYLNSEQFLYCTRDLIGEYTSVVEYKNWDLECRNNPVSPADFASYAAVLHVLKTRSKEPYYRDGDRLIFLKYSNASRVYAKYKVPSDKRGGYKAD